MDDLIDRGGNTQNSSPGNLPHANAVLALGIISIATFWLYGVPGIVCGIIAIVLHRKNRAVYLTDPAHHDAAYKNSKAGNICGIIGLSLSVFFLLFIVIAVAWVVSTFPRNY